MTVSELTTKYNQAHKAWIEAQQNGATTKTVTQLYTKAKIAQQDLLRAQREEKK